MTLVRKPDAGNPHVRFDERDLETELRPPRQISTLHHGVVCAEAGYLRSRWRRVASRQARRRAWDVLQELRVVLAKLGNATIEVPSRKTFEAEGAILKQALSDCLRDQRAALAQLADAARQVDKAAFGSTAGFGPAHQALLKALDRAEVLLQD